MLLADQSTLETTNEAAVPPLLLPPPTTAGSVKQSFVDGPHPLCIEADNAGQKHQRGRRCLRMLRPCYLLRCVDTICCLSCYGAKTIKGRSEQKLNTSFTNRQSESDLKMQKHFAKNRLLVDVSDCMQRFYRLCCEMLKDWNIQTYTQPLIKAIV